jgi:feruloyl esterase
MKQALTVVALAILTAPVGGRAMARQTASPSTDACAALTSIAMPASKATLAEARDVPLSPTNRAFSAAICRVQLLLAPSADSEIKVEIWLPVSGWNGKYQAVGNGAFTGTINYSAMAAALRRGYAVSSTDTGHTGGGAAWALGHPEKVIDFGYRAVHEMAGAAKRVITAYYRSAPRLSYWNGCSAGGRQAMMEAQRFPDDFDGVIAGAPGLDWTGRAAQANRIAKVLEANSSARLTEDHRELLHNAVLDACDALDGVKDGLLENPDRCTFDPGALACKGTDTRGCLTPTQIDTARMIYSSPVNPRTGRRIAGLARGSERGWTDLGWTASARATGLDQFRYLVFGDAGWTVEKFDFDIDIVRAEERDAGTINALDANLEPFIRGGGKLLHYHGWSDPQISPGSSVQYYTRVVEALGDASRVDSAYRLFMAPGMGHCGGGTGPNTFDMLGALEQWVEAGKAPDSILASQSLAGGDRTRPLCPYPKVAVYRGTGSPNDAKNFACK